jgi:hypothetical protein
MPPTSSALQPASSLAPCDLVSHDLSPVLHCEHTLSPPGSTAEPGDSQRGSEFNRRYRVSFHPSPTRPRACRQPSLRSSAGLDQWRGLDAASSCRSVPLR